MVTTLSSRLIGRLAGLLFMGCGVFTIGYVFLPGLSLLNRAGVVAVCLAAVASGLVAWFAPWYQWSRSATLWLAPVGFALIALGNYWGDVEQPYSFGIFFVVVFCWIGTGHPQWTALKMAPVGVLAYVLPLIARSAEAPGAITSVALTIPVSILLGEGLAWIVAREQRSREQAQALARIGTALGSQLSEEGVFQTLTDEARSALGAEHSVLYRLEPGARTIREVFSAGLAEPLREGLLGLRGMELTDVPLLDKLEEGEPVVVERIEDADVASVQIARTFGLRSFMMVPVRARDGLMGALFCGNTTKRGRYGPDQLSLARSIAAQAGVAIQNAALYQRTLEASLMDPLTELRNRRAFHDRLSSEIERSRRHGRHLSLVLMDLDEFKQVNDAWGHQTGDRVLVRLAEHFRRNLRRGDGAYRIGGDEFALILPETDPAAAARLTERIRRSVARATLGGGRDLRLSLSCGVGCFPEHGTSPDELFARADAAMYGAKAAGGDAVAVSPAPLGREPGTLFGLDMRDILSRRLLRASFQPIVELATGRVIGYESFCHLDPSAGNAPTTTLFRAAGSMGMVPELDRLCRELSLAALESLPATARLFLNVSPAVLEDPGFNPSEIVEAVTAAGLPPGRVVIEVTEQERAPTSEMLARNLRRCRAEGFEVALDDLGAGGADLELLARLPFNYVKVDMAFVHGTEGDEGRRRLLQGLRLLVEQTGAQAIAEGIETADDFRMVTSMGFWAGQGFLLGIPSETLGAVSIPSTQPATSPR